VVTTDSTVVVKDPVSIAIIPPSSFDGLGFSLVQAFTGDLTLLPVISGKGQFFYATTPVTFGTTGSGITGALGDETSGVGEGETLALWLSVEIASPDAEPVTIERTLLDRLGAARNGSSPPDLAAIPPVEIVDPFGLGASIPELLSANLVHVAAARLPVSYALVAERASPEADVQPLIGPSMTAFRDTLRLDAETTAGWTSYVARPQVSLSTVSLANPDDPLSAAVASIDLLHHETAIVPLAGAAPDDVPPLLHAGVLDQVAEHLALHPVTVAGAETIVLTSPYDVASVMDAAADQRIPLVAVTTPDELAAINLDDAARLRLEHALALGHIAVLPEQRVEVDGGSHLAWWLIDPATGAAHDETEDGRGYATRRLPQPHVLFSTAVEDAELNEAAAKMQPWYRRMGKAVDCGFAIATIALSVGGGGLAASTGNAVGVVSAVVGLAKGIKDANKALGGGGCR
jgi:hypothetical protein